MYLRALLWYNMRMRKIERTICIVFAVLVAAAYAYWALTAQHTLLSLGAAALSAFLFGAVLLRLVPNTVEAFTLDAPISPDALLGKRTLRFTRRHPWLSIIFFVLITRVVLYAAAYAAHTLFQGYSGGIFETLRDIWLRSDSPSYMGIAENWYVTSGDARFHIVFFPLYPLVIRLVNYLTYDSFISAMLISNTSCMIAGILMYEIAALDLDRRAALRCVRYLLIIPGSFFFAAPMTEALFLVLTLAAVLLIRKKHYFFGAVFGALSAFTRSLGVIILVFAVYEYIADLLKVRRDGQKQTRRLILGGLSLLIIPFGLAGYLYVNYRVTGNMLTFAAYQSEHWSQGFGLFFSTAAYQSELMLTSLANGDVSSAWALWIPNVIMSFAALIIVLPAQKLKRMRAGYVAYFLVYFAVCIGATWLLSAPRYLAACFALPFALTLLTDDPRADAAVSVVCSLAALAYCCMYAIGYHVY